VTSSPVSNPTVTRDDARVTTAPEKLAAQRAIARAADACVALSHRIHADPELSFEEEHASTWCADALEAAGFDVERGVAELPTAFRASVGSGPLGVAICCEYDALPDIGHACGHNVIAGAAVGAGIGLAEIADDLGITLRVLGTPAEEGGGGKILMLERGVFDGIGAAMMVHPWPAELLQMPCLAITHFDVEFTGVESHASAYPELGRNAADAITVAQVAIGLLRQHGCPGDQVHGIVTHGGSAPNIVPAHTSAQYYVRSKTLARLAEWEPRIRDCFRAGALATGTTVAFDDKMPAYSEFEQDEELAAIYGANAEALGRVFAPVGERSVTASTDMANVSLALPSIHPTLGLDSLPAVNHQAAFAAHCVTPIADRALVDGAMAMAWTVIDAATDPSVRPRLMHSAFRSG
jgi:amidohydrolase